MGITIVFMVLNIIFGAINFEIYAQRRRAINLIAGMVNGFVALLMAVSIYVRQ